MRDTIIKLFNLEPSELEDVEVTHTDYSVFIFVTLKRKFQRCPDCGCSTKVIHDYRERTLAHPIINDAFTTIVFKQRRYRCINCDKIFPEANPFAFPNKRVSKFVVLRVMKMLKNPRVTFTMAAKEIGISTSSVIRIFDKYAGITPISLPVCLGIDEVYAIKYKQKIFACVLVDLNSNQIYDLLPSRKKAELCAYFSRIPREERCKVKYVCMDMYQLYKDVAEVYFPEAKICVDSFHVVKLICNACDNVRIRIMKQFDTSSEEYQLLKNFNWLLRKSYQNVKKSEYINLKKYYYLFDSQYVMPDTLINMMISFNVELELAYSLKEEYLYWNKRVDESNAERFVAHMAEEFASYGIRELSSVAKTLRNWQSEIVNSFNHHKGRRISNGPVESVNSRIKVVKRNGNGYSNFERFRKRVIYSLNEDSSIKI